MRQFVILFPFLFLPLAGCDVDPEEAKRNAHRPSDGIAAFVDGCIIPDASETHARAAFAQHKVKYGIADTPSGHFPAGEVFTKTGNKYIDRLTKNAGFETRCTVRVRNLWVDDALDPVSKQLAEEGFRKVANAAPHFVAYNMDSITFRKSPVSGIYLNRNRRFLIMIVESTQPPGRITDLTLGLLE